MRRSMHRLLPGTLAVLAIALFVGWLYRDWLPIGGQPKSQLKWDSVAFSYPFLALTSRFLHEGVAPFWNPFVFCGTPFFGNLQNLLFNPPSLLVASTTHLTLAHFQGLEVAQIAIGAIGMYLWGVARSGSRLAAWVGAVVFAGSGCVINFSTQYLLLALHCLLPYPFLLFELWDRERKHAYLVLTSVAIASWLFTSYPSQLGYYLVAFAVYFVAKRLRNRASMRRVVFELSFVALAPILVASVHLVPAILMLPQLTRSGGIDIEEVYRQSLHPVQLYSTLMGGASSLPSVFTTPDVALRDYSLGVFGWCAILYGLRRSRLLLFVGLLACADLMLGRHSLLISTLHRVSPLSANSRHPTCEFGSLFAFIGITLIVGGVADLLRRPIEWKRGLIALGVLAGAVLSFQLVVDDSYPSADPNRLRWIALGVPSCAWASFACALMIGRAGAPRALGLAALAVGPLVESTMNRVWNVSITEQTAKPNYFAGEAAACRRAQSHYVSLDPSQPRRALYPRESNLSMLTGERADWGYDASISTTQRAAIENPHAREVLLAPAPAFVADQVQRVEHPERVPLLQSDRHVAAFSSDLADVPTSLPAKASVRVLDYGPNRARYSIAADGPAVVVFNELHLPGWSLTIDGRDAPVRTANGYFRSVFAPAGTHEYVFTYWPVGLTAGLALSGVGVALLVVASLLRRRLGGAV